MDTQLKTVNTKQSIIRFFLTAFFVLGGTLLITAFLPPLPEGITSEQITENGISIGFFALIPALFLIVYIFTTKRILEALILATLMCFIFADRTHFLSEFNTGLTSVMMDEDTGWLIIVCGLMGSIIKLIEINVNFIILCLISMRIPPPLPFSGLY